MFSRSKRVRRDPYSLSIPLHQAEPPIRLDRRHEAWVLGLGQPRDWPGSRFRPHRGMLPDVDLLRLVPVERRPGLMARLFRRIFGRDRVRKEPGDPSGSTEGSHAALGETPRKPYVWLVETESEAFEQEEFQQTLPYNGSRAA